MPSPLPGPTAQSQVLRPSFRELHETLAHMKRDREEIGRTIEQSLQTIEDTRSVLALSDRDSMGRPTNSASTATKL